MGSGIRTGTTTRSVIAIASWFLFLVFVSKHIFSNSGSRVVTHGRIGAQSRGFSRHLLEIPSNGSQVLDGRSSDVAANASSTQVLDAGSDDRSALVAANGGSSADVGNTDDACKDAWNHFGYQDTCSFIKAHEQCKSGGVIEYSQVFFCRFGAVPWLGYALLGLWLAALFYMLGNTAADYFCCSLQKLSSLLRLPPTVAGVSLLPLGNGAPDVFASIAAFVGAGAGEVGLNSVLGGALFVTSVVGGLVYVVVGGTSVRLDRHCFIRDVSFFLFTLMCMVAILYIGKIHLWGAVAFISIYLVYGVTVAASEVIKQKASKFKWQPMQALAQDGDDEEGWYSPLMDPDSTSSHPIETTLPQWRWVSHVAIYAHQQAVEEAPRPLWGWSEQQEVSDSRSWSFLRNSCMMLLDWPLTLPRQLTIPLVEDGRWSRPVAVASVTLAPVLLAVLLNDGISSQGSLHLYIWGLGIGFAFGLLAFFTTVSEHPPRTFLLPWVAAGFLMSIVWFYIIAKELVAVLVSLGVILEIDSAILGLTVLAWGNSMGDLMANTAMAYKGGDGVQVAVSGCYAGPMFNTLVGLGASLVLASWHTYPAPFVVPIDNSLYYTIGFLVVGLVWALAILPSRKMQPSQFLGIGLLVLYSSFLLFRIFHASGFLSRSGAL